MPLHPLVATWDADVRGDDPLGWPGYEAPARESVLTGRTEHYALVEGCFDVIGGSMGAAHGERVVRAYRRARDERLPVVVVATSGGARMQEGMVSLIQMARTADAARTHAEAGLLQLAVLRSPTTGGVFASYASLADLRAATPGATIGFAGPRVVELVTGDVVGGASHTAEAAHAAGLVDAVVPRADQPAWVEAALGLRPQPLPRRDRASAPRVVGEGAWAEVQLARAPGRPTGIDWAARLCSSWTELRGADPTVRAGLGTLAADDRRVVVVATDRYAGDGRPRPAGFRLAQRALALAGRLRLPVLTLVDTPGAAMDAEAENAGIAGEIARTFAAMASLPTPSVSVCVGEGGSGGALALACADRLLMQQHAIFSVIAPEGAAAILERNAAMAPELAPRMRLTASDLVDLGIADDVVPETIEGTAAAVRRALTTATADQRRDRFDRATERWIREGDR